MAHDLIYCCSVVPTKGFKGNTFGLRCYMEAVNYSYSDGSRDEQLLVGLIIGHMKPSLGDALKKEKM